MLELRSVQKANPARLMRQSQRGMRLALDRSDMNSLKVLVIILLVVVAVVVLSVCADGLAFGCSHACCTGIERSRSQARLVRRLKCVCRSIFDLMWLLMGWFSRILSLTSASLNSTSVLLRVSALRI